MAKTPATPNMPINHPNLSAGEEYSEDALHHAEAENEEFYESAYDFMTGNEVTLLQSGISEKVARALIRKRPALNPAAPPGTNYSRAVGEEKLTAALYREVHGQKIHDTEHGEDYTNYELSVNRQHLDSPWHRRFGRQVSRVARGAVSAIFNNTVEANVARRFGRNKDPIARRDFVVRQRLEQPLLDLQGADPVSFDALAGILGLPAGSAVIDVQDQMAIPDAPIPLTALRTIRRNLQANVAGLAFVSTPAFRDFELLVKLDQQHTADFGVSAVYDREPIREFFAALEVDLQNVILSALEEDEIYKLKDNPDGTSLLSNIRGRFYELVVVGMPQAAAMDEIRREVAEIRQQECLAAAQTPENAELINNINTQINELRGRNQRLGASFISLNQLVANIAAEEARIIGPPPLVGDDLRNARNNIANMRTEQNQAIAAHVTLEGEYKENARSLIVLLERIPNHPAIPPVLVVARDVNLTPEANLRIPIAGPFFNHITHHSVALNNVFDQTIPNDFLSLLANKTRMTAFVLLQRMFRRDYMRRRNLAAFHANPNLYNAEANHYANVKAALRVEDVKSADRKRSANQRAAELLDRGIAGRGWDKVKGAVARGQNFFGLEPINFAEITADKLLDQLVNSEDEFTVFKGINKYTTVRDLRQIINKTGREVKKETLERFSMVLEEAISRFKKVRPSLEKGLHADDWDLENLITVFKKLKIEMWSQEFMEQVENSGEPGQRELNLVRMLRGSREQERRIEKTIEADVKDADAIWRVYLAKADLKKVLDKDQLNAANEIRAHKIKEKQARITQKQAQLNSLPEGHADRAGLEAEINNLRNSIVTVEKQTRMAQTLYDRVEEAKTYIYSHKLSRKQRKEYLESVGLAQVFDKMSTNFKLQRAWHYTKKAAAATWRGTKGTWAWSRRKFLNKETAGKVYEVGRLLASPGVAIAKGTWTVGTFIPSLIGRGLLGTTRMPKRLVGTMNHNTLRSYYRERIANLVRKINKVKAKHRRLKEQLDRVHYSFTKQRIAKRMNELEHEGYKLMRQIVSYQKSAAERKVMLGDIAHYTEANAEPGSVEFESFK